MRKSIQICLYLRDLRCYYTLKMYEFLRFLFLLALLLLMPLYTECINIVHMR